MKNSLRRIALAGALFIASPIQAAPVGHGDIVDVAAERGSFATLIAAIKAAGLESTLRGDGPFTIFAPTDEAFANLPAGALEALLADEEALKRVLTHHVVAGQQVDGHEMNMVGSLRSAQGQSLDLDAFSSRDEQIRIGGARIIESDLEASNGVIHIIDAVLIPN